MCLTGEILTDRSRLGRDRPWKIHKSNSTLLAESFERLGRSNKAERVLGCGSTLKFNVCPSGHEKRLFWANFCRVRICPMCAWRRSLLLAHQLKLVAHEAVKRHPMRWLFLTLTVKNCSDDELNTTINRLMDAWKRFNRVKVFKSNVIGWFRSLEVTRNMMDGSYHPHFHVLLGVKHSYFNQGYLNQKDWVQLWQNALQVDYVPIVDIRIVKNKKRNIMRELEILDAKGIQQLSDGRLIEADLSGSAVAELAKYATKSNDYLIYKQFKQKQEGKNVVLVPDVDSGIDEFQTDRAVATLDTSLNARRLVSYGGLLKEVWNNLQREGKVQDAEADNADLVHTDDNTNCHCSVCGSDMLEELYSWIPSTRNYIKKESVDGVEHSKN